MWEFVTIVSVIVICVLAAGIAALLWQVVQALGKLVLMLLGAIAAAVLAAAGAAAIMGFVAMIGPPG